MRKPFIIIAAALGLVACKNHQEPSQMPGGGVETALEDQDEGQPGYEAEDWDEEEEAYDESEDQDDEEAQRVKDVVKDPQFGERVTVEGEVDTVYLPQAFTMKAGIFRDDLLVVAPRDLVIEALQAPDKVRVVGTVKKMVAAEVEREFSVDFDNAMEVKWENQPYLSAESLERVPD